MALSKLEALMTLLRSGLYSKPVDKPELLKGVDWNQLLAMAKKQTVLGIVAQSISFIPDDAKPPKEVQDKLLNFAVHNFQSHALLNSVLVETASMYSKHGILGVLLKGQGVARNYPTPEMRQCGDIDMYVGEANFQRACEVADAELNEGKRTSVVSEKHYNVDRRGVTIEIHRKAAAIYTPWRSGKLQKWITDSLENPDNLSTAMFNGVEVRVPSPDFNAIYIFLHAWQHMISGGIGLRQLIDWSMVLHKHASTIDRPALEQRIKEFGLERPWTTFGYIVVNSLGLPREEFPLYTDSAAELGEKALKDVMNGGNFGFHHIERKRSTSSMPFFKRKLNTLVFCTKTYFSIFKFHPLETTCYYLRTIAIGLKVAAQSLLSSKK